MSFLDDRLYALVDSLILEPYFKDVLKKEEYDRIQYKLKKNVQEKLVEKYGEEGFFNNFDKFLVNNETIDKFIAQCYRTEKQKHIESNTWINNICEGFTQEYPQYSVNSSTIKIILNELYNVIFNTLNNSRASDDLRIINNNLIDIASTLECNITNELRRIKNEILSEKNNEIAVTEESSSYVIGQAKELSKLFVETSFFKETMESVNQNNTIVLVGNSGIGKTTMSFMLANKFRDAYKITLIEGTDNEGANIINNLIKSIKDDIQKNEIIVFDDFLGKTKLNNSEEYLLAIEELLKTMKNCSSKKLILNSRKTILESAKKVSNGLEEFLLFDTEMLDCTNKYNDEDRMKIFAGYILKNQINNTLEPLLADDKTLYSIINHVNFNPLIIDRATRTCKAKKPEQFGETIIEFLDNPKFLWEKEIKALDTNALNYLFVLYSLSDTFIEKEIVDDCYKFFIKNNGIKQTEHLEDAVKCLTALVSYDNKGKIRLRHPSLIDYLYQVIYSKKDELLSGAVYFEQIERIDDEKEKITELLEKPEMFFKFKVFPIKFIDNSIELPNHICVKYLKYIFELDIRNKEYEDVIIVALEEIFKHGRMLLLFSTDVIINILSMKYYDLNSILTNKEYTELLYDCSNSENIWKLIKATITKDEQGYDFSKIESNTQNEILNKMGEIATEEIEKVIKLEFSDYLLDNIDDYNEDDDYEDIAQNIIEMIVEDIDLEEIENNIKVCAQKHKLYNLDLSEMNSYMYNYDNSIDDFAIGKIQDYFVNH